jgi:hypothetical protein
MPNLLRRPTARLCALLVSALVVASGVAAQPIPATAAQADGPRPATVPALPAAVVAAAEHTPGVVVRRVPGLVVRAIAVPVALRTAHPAVPATVWRVRVAGRFPPRALRYIVSAGSQPVGYGTPSFRMNAAVAVTADPAVLTETVTARYEGGAAGPASPGTGGSGLSAARAVRSLAAQLGGAADPDLDVARRTYSMGNQAYQPPGIQGKVELAGVVHYPKDLSGGPFPLVLFLHGNHDSCYKGAKAGYRWPCPAGWTPMPNDIGYDYIAERLASFGYIVVSVSGNGVNVLGNQLPDTGMRQRGYLLRRHLDLWQKWSTIGHGPFGTRFVGKVDMTRIGAMGHSRGGEGVTRLVMIDRKSRDPYGIDAVLPLAPVDFDRKTLSDIPMAVILPYCDGDVSDLEGMHYFDDARYRKPGDPTPKATVTVMGANHNFFNTVWTPKYGYPGSFDDGLEGCPGRIPSGEQRTAGRVFVVDFFRRYVGGTLKLDQIWTGEKTPGEIAPVQALVSYMAPDVPGQRKDLDRFTSSQHMVFDDLGGTVVTNQLALHRWCPESLANPCVPGRYRYTDAHLPGLPQAILGWANATGSIRFNIPAGEGDVDGFDVLQFRVAVNPGYQANGGVAAQDLVVELHDASGNVAQVAASSVPNAALAFPPGLPAGHVILNQIRFPLSWFTGVDLMNVTAVRLLFSKTTRGVIDVSDLAFSRGAQP